MSPGHATSRAYALLGPVRELLLQGEGFRADGIVPLAMEVMADEVDGLEFGVWHLDAGGICETCIRGAQWLATATRAAHALAVGRIAIGQFIQAATDRAARNAGGAHHSTDPAGASRHCFSRRKATQAVLIKHRSHHLKAQPNRRFIDHLNLISCCESSGNPVPEKNSVRPIHLFPDGALVSCLSASASSPSHRCSPYFSMSAKSWPSTPGAPLLERHCA